MRRPLRLVLVLGALAGLVLALVRMLGRTGRPGPASLAPPPASLPATTPVVRNPVPVEVADPAPSPAAEADPAPSPGPEPAPVLPEAEMRADPEVRAEPEAQAAVAPEAGPEPAPGREAGEQPAWVAPVEGGCPGGYPIKAKVASGIYHRPGGQSYQRTRPDRCYADEAAAEADGFRAAKR